jgi:drug/metabolite transporter (DMT)-like permease
MRGTDLYKIHISVFLFGFAGLFGKWIYLDALSIVWGRVLFASLAFGVLFAFQGRNPFKISLKQYSSYLFLGALLAFHWWSFFMGIQKSTVAIGLFSFASFPVFTVLLESLFFNEKWKSQYLFLALLSFLGISLLLPDLNWNNGYLQGVIWGVLSGFSFALLTIYNRKLLPKSSAIEIAFFQDLYLLMSRFGIKKRAI